MKYHKVSIDQQKTIHVVFGFVCQSEPYCDTGEKDLLLCKVYSLTNRTLIEREYSQFISCADVDGTEGAKSFWIFEVNNEYLIDVLVCLQV